MPSKNTEKSEKTERTERRIVPGIFSALCLWGVICLTLIFAVQFVRLLDFDLLDRLQEYAYVFSDDLRETPVYKNAATDTFAQMYYAAESAVPETGDENNVYVEKNGEGYVYFYDGEGAQIRMPFSVYSGLTDTADMLYRVVSGNSNADGVFTNAAEWDPNVLPADFNYRFSFVDGTVKIEYKDKDLGTRVVYSSDVPGSFYNERLSTLLSQMQISGGGAKITSDHDIYFAVRDHAMDSGAGIIGLAERYVRNLAFQLAFAAAILLLYLLMLFFAVFLRRDRHALELGTAKVLSHIWFEVKVFLVVFSGFLIFSALPHVYGWYAVLLVAFLLFIVYLLLIDLCCNRRVWRCNILKSAAEALLLGNGKSRFETKLRRKCVVMILAAALALVLGVPAVVFCARISSPIILLLLCVAVIAAVCGSMLWFSINLQEDLAEHTRLMGQIERMYRGDLNAAGVLPVTSALYGPSMELNMIRDGIRLAVEQGVSSERMKVELITNVSHDIKTPLTSIISYISLLRAEPDLSPQAREYVEIIAQKSDRLRHMVQDIFDLSKAATGNLPLEMKPLSLTKLLRQTLAEMDTVLQESRLTWRVQIPETACIVRADGQKLYRVFQNLIKNAAQYALEGSRVYVSLYTENGYVKVVIQNVTRNEMQLDGEQLMARFVRGDESRSASGSGLGLSIARSFTEACGGTCRVDVQGDLFTAEIVLPLCPEAILEQPEAAPDAPEESVSMPESAED